MKKNTLFAMLLLASLLAAFPGEAAEKLYICRPCSRAFIPQAQEVITSLGLEQEISIAPSSCLGGPCDAQYVVKFQGTVYPYMNTDTLRQMLISVCKPKETPAE
jgi:hypothetical protein